MNLFKGGGPRNVYSLVRVLIENGYEAKILSFSDPRFVLTGDQALDSYAVGVPYLLPSKYITIAESFIQLTESFPMISGTAIPLSSMLKYRILKGFPRSDLYVATYWQSFYPVYSLCMREKKPMLYFVQADETTFGSSYFYKKFAERTYRIQSIRITQSKWLKSFLDERYGGENHYLGFGVDKNKFKPNKCLKENVVFTIARPARYRGFDIFVNAMNILWSRRKDFAVTIAGYIPESQRSIMKFPYEFIGWVRDDNMLSNLYSRFIFVNTGRHEALPMPPLEAMSCGSAVVLTDMDSIREYAKDGINCLIAQNENPSSIADRVDELLSSESLRNKISSGGLKTAQDYDWKIVYERFIDIINNISG